MTALVDRLHTEANRKVSFCQGCYSTALYEEAATRIDALEAALREISEIGCGEEEPAFDPNGDTTLFGLYDAGFVCGLTRMGKLARKALESP